MQMLYKVLILAGLMATGLGLTAVARAEDDVAAIRTAAAQYVAALRRADVDALRKMWTPEGNYMDAAGQTYKVREILSHRDAEMPRDAGSGSLAMPESTVRFAAPDVAIEDGVCARGMTDDGGTLTCRFTSIWVKRDGRWRLDSLREAAVVSPSARDQLRSLDWLIGEWAGATEGGAILVSSHWSDEGHYLMREFAELVDGGGPVTSTQRIGWDAAAGKIKCWTFDSQGGAAEGVWRHDGKRWIVETTAVMPDGKKSMTTATYIPSEGGRFVWETAGIKVAGENVPPRRIEFKRAAER